MTTAPNSAIDVYKRQCEACVGTCPKQNIHRWDLALCKHQWLPVLGKALLFFLLGCWLGFCRFI